VVAQVPASEASVLATAVGVQHPHLATLLAVFDPPDAGFFPDDGRARGASAVAVAQWASGRTMHETLKNPSLRQALPLMQAVRMVANVTSAVAALHAKGAVHGSVCSRNIIVERVDGGPCPLLLQASCVADGAFASPERLLRPGLSALDDVWALHVLLYAVLTGRRPFLATTRESLISAMHNAKPLPLAAFGLCDAPDLQSLLDAGLARDPALRTRRVDDVEACLHDWLARVETGQWASDVAGSLATPSAPRSKIPRDIPPSSDGPLRFDLPASMADDGAADDSLGGRPVSSSSSAIRSLAALGLASEPRPLPEPAPVAHLIKPASVWPKAAAVLLGAGILAVALGGFAISRLSADAPTAGPVAPLSGQAPSLAVASAAPKPSLTTTAAALVDPVPQSANHATAGAINACVASYFPPASFDAASDLTFPCDERDPRVGAHLVGQKLALAGGGASTAGMKEWSQLQWHRLPAYAMIRAGCCATAAPLELPAPVARCPSVTAALNALGASPARRPTDISTQLAAFRAAADCAVRNADAAYSSYIPHAVADSSALFDRFVQRNRER
jgi:hypothetical protein